MSNQPKSFYKETKYSVLCAFQSLLFFFFPRPEKWYSCFYKNLMLDHNITWWNMPHGERREKKSSSQNCNCDRTGSWIRSTLISLVLVFCSQKSFHEPHFPGLCSSQTRTRKTYGTVSKMTYQIVLVLNDLTCGPLGPGGPWGPVAPCKPWNKAKC